jgi:eukaryotic-like serine/threonine-protein kinase
MGDDALLSPGLIIAETYEIDRQLGRGGMGEVWLARHRRLAGKQVAVKVLRAQGQVSTEALARFKREAEIAARLEHPNIVQVLDYNTLPTGEPFLVMELLKGQSLAERLRAGPLPLEEVRQVVRQVGSALERAHAGGVVHRDLKPENLFLVPTALGPQVKVLDFGISKLADSQTVQTTDAVLIGTPLYMSPEQATGNNKEVGPQSDLFSLGSICFELLTGQPPFKADSVAQVVFRIAYEKPPSLAAARGDLPPEVVAAVEHALTKDKAQRTPDIATFVQEFTGTSLAGPTPAEAGVYTPGMEVSESLMSGKTVNPVQRSRATPGAPTPPPAPSPASPVSGRRLALGLVAVAVLGAAAIVYVRVDVWQNHLRPVEDAGAALGGAGPVATSAPVPDAATAVPSPVERDAGPRPAPRVEVVRAVEPPGPSDTPTAEDQQALDRLRAMRERADWEGLELQRNSVHRLASRRAQLTAWSWVVDAMCHRMDNQLLAPAIAELKGVADRGTLRSTRKACEAVYPAAADLAW